MRRYCGRSLSSVPILGVVNRPLRQRHGRRNALRGIAVAVERLALLYTDRFRVVGLPLASTLLLARRWRVEPRRRVGPPSTRPASRRPSRGFRSSLGNRRSSRVTAWSYLPKPSSPVSAVSPGMPIPPVALSPSRAPVFVRIPGANVRLSGNRHVVIRAAPEGRPSPIRESHSRS